MRRQSTDHAPVRAPKALLHALWRYLSPVLKDNRHRVGFALLFLLAAKGALLVIPFILKTLVDGMDKSQQAMPLTWILVFVMAYGAARLGTTLFGELRDTLFGRVTERAMRKIGLQVFKHVHQLDLDYHLNRKTGGLARDIERGTTGISFLMRFFIFNIAPTLFEIGMVLVILLSQYGGKYAAVVVIAVLTYGYWSFKATAWRTKYVRAQNEADSHSNTRAVDSLLNYETVKYFTNERFEAERYDASLADWETARRQNRWSLFLLNGVQALIIAIAQTVMLALAAIDVHNNAISLGDFVLINQFMLQLFMPLGFLGFVYREIKASLANIEKLFDLFEIAPKVEDPADGRALAIKDGAIEFEHVRFAYHEDRPLFQDLSFSVCAGETVALVGSSGSGKSSIVKLLFRFYDPDSGAIRVDGQDIRAVTQESLRKEIAIVPQDCVLFNDSLQENIRYGRPDATDAEIDAAINAAHLRDFIDSLPEGSATTVGERGLKLSGGEKQRVAIARAVLKGAKILVFDEATSSLDSKAERAVLSAFRELAGTHTSLVIAHRLSTVVDADKIIVLEQGQLVEQGTHQMLLASNGVYAELWQAQQRELTGNSVKQSLLNSPA